MLKATARALPTIALCSLIAVGCGVGGEEDAAPDGVAMSSDALTGSIATGSSLRTTARVNLREGPSTSDDVIRTLPLGAIVTVVDASPKNGFYHVAHEGDDGWSYGAYLKATSPAPATTDPDDGEVTSPSGDFNGRTFSNVTVLWQGNWSFLVQCDSYSRRQGKVVFFCDENPSRSFVDDGAWLAMPRASFTRAMCGQSARVCKGARCIEAKIVEKSETAGRWEGSAAVLDALGVQTGFRGCSSSFGTATGVTITLR